MHIKHSKWLLQEKKNAGSVKIALTNNNQFAQLILSLIPPLKNAISIFTSNYLNSGEINLPYIFYISVQIKQKHQWWDSKFLRNLQISRTGSVKIALTNNNQFAQLILSLFPPLKNAISIFINFYAFYFSIQYQLYNEKYFRTKCSFLLLIIHGQCY